MAVLQEIPFKEPTGGYGLMNGFSPVYVQAGSDTTAAVRGCDETHFP